MGSSIIFRGETLGEIVKKTVNMSGGCGVSVTPIIEQRNGKPYIKDSIKQVTGAKQMRLSLSYLVEVTENIDETMSYVSGEIERLVDKEGTVYIDDEYIGDAVRPLTKNKVFVQDF